VFVWIKRHGRSRFEKLVVLWRDARQIPSGKVTKVVDEIWYLRRNVKFASGSSRVWSTPRSLYVLFSVGDRDQRSRK
jgi:hypothetical protein